MQTIILYKYIREDGGISTSPVKPNAEYTEMFRLVADEEKALTRDGVNLASCVDVVSIDGWYEVDAPTDESIEADELSELKQKAQAYDIITGVSE